jgi:acylphosphatase
MEEKKAARVLIHGRVQGVAFRYNTRLTADSLSLTGWVKNLANGEVEALFEGNENNINQMIDWCRKGPAMSAVSGVDVEWVHCSGQFNGFEIVFS